MVKLVNDKKLSIIFVTNNYTPYQGGVVSSITQHAHALRKQGHSVTIITLDFIPQTPPEEHVIRLYCPIRFYYKTNPMAIPWLPSTSLKKLLTKIKPDIIHTHHPFLLGKAALKTAKNLKIPIVFTYHTLYDQYLHYIPLPTTLTAPLVNNLVRSFCNEVDGIIAPSSVVKDYINTHAIPTLITIIPSSISTLFFQKKITETKKPHHPFRLLTVSRFAQEKNIPFLLDVMALLNHNHFEFTLAGYGPEYKNLQNYAYKYKKFSTKHVQFVEKPTKQTLIDLYEQADIFIFASTSETQGLVLIEAMAQGTPVIALEGPGQRDLIENGINGFLIKNPEDMKQKIEECMHNKLLHETLQKNALLTAQQYTPQTLLSKLVNFYFSILKPL